MNVYNGILVDSPGRTSINMNGGSLSGGITLWGGEGGQPAFSLHAQNGTRLDGDVNAYGFERDQDTLITLASGATWQGTIRNNEPDSPAPRIVLTLADSNTKWTLTDSTSLSSIISYANYNSATQRIENAPSIDFGSFTGTYKTLTVNQIGLNADLYFNTYLGDSNSPSDKLVIDGGWAYKTAAWSQSRVFIRNTGGLGAQTTGNGILLIEAINGGGTEADGFYLGQPVIAGAYDYSLVRNGQNWYLSSAYTTNPPPPGPDPEPGPSQPPQNFRAESSLYAAAPAQALAGMAQALTLPAASPVAPLAVQVASADNATAMQALAERERAVQDPPVWVRAVGNHSRNRNQGQGSNGAHWAQFQNDSAMLQAGWRLSQSVRGDSASTVSLIAAMGQVHGDVTHTDAAGQQQQAGSNQLDVLSLGAALSRRFDARHYLEGAAMLSHLRAKTASDRGLGFKSRGIGLAASLEGGMRLPLSSGWGWQPHALLRVMQAELDDSSDTAGVVRFGTARSLQAGVGASLHTQGERATQFRLGAQLLHEFSGQPQTVLADAAGNHGQSFYSSTRGSSVQLSAELEHSLGRNSKLFASLAHRQGLNSDNRESRDSTATLGASFRW